MVFLLLLLNTLEELQALSMVRIGLQSAMEIPHGLLGLPKTEGNAPQAVVRLLALGRIDEDAPEERLGIQRTLLFQK